MTRFYPLSYRHRQSTHRIPDHRHLQQYSRTIAFSTSLFRAVLERVPSLVIVVDPKEWYRESAQDFALQGRDDGLVVHCDV